MMKRGMWVLAAIVLVILPAGCRQTRIPETTKVLDAEALGLLTGMSASGRLTFSGSSGMLANLEAGDVVVAGISGSAPSGLLRKVISVNRSAGEVVLETGAATLTDAVERGSLKLSRQLTTADIAERKALVPGVSVAKQGEGFFVGMDNVVVYENESGKVTVSGNITATPSFDLNVEIEDFLVQEIEFTQQTQLLATCELHADFSYTLPESWEKKLFTFVFTPIEFSIGTVPVVLVPQMTVFLNAEGAVSAHLAASAICQRTATLNAGYADGEWSASGSLTTEPLDHSPPTLSGTNAGVRIAAGPDFSLLLYGLAGPYGKAQAFMAFEASAAKAPLQWTLSGGVDAWLGFDVGALGLDVAEYPLTQLVHVEEVVAEGDGETPDEGEGETEGEGEGEPVPQSWSKTYGGFGVDTFSGVVQCADGGYAAIGSTDAFGFVSANLWVARFSAAGTAQWQTSVGGANASEGTALLETGDGGLLAAGTTRAFGAGEADLWLLRLSATGAVLWQKTYGGTSIEGGTVLAEASDGYILAGNTYSYDSGPEDDDADVLVVKVGADGTLQWAGAYTGFGSHASVGSVLRTSDGDIVLGGTVYDAWMMRLDSAGAVKWAFLYPDARNFAALAESADGVLAAGKFMPWYSVGSINPCVLLVDSAGTVQWARVYEQEGQTAEAVAMDLTPDGGCAVAINRLDSKERGWLLRLNDSGQVVWARDYHPAGTGMAFGGLAITQDAGGLNGIVAAGSVDFPLPTTDAWLMKLPADGQITFNAASGGTSTSLSGTFGDVALAPETAAVERKNLNALLSVADSPGEAASTAAAVHQQAP